MSKKTEEILTKEQAGKDQQVQTPPTKEQLNEIRMSLLIPALTPMAFYSPSAQIERLEAKVNEIAMKFNTLVNMLMGTVI